MMSAACDVFASTLHVLTRRSAVLDVWQPTNQLVDIWFPARPDRRGSADMWSKAVVGGSQTTSALVRHLLRTGPSASGQHRRFDPQRGGPEKKPALAPSAPMRDGGTPIVTSGRRKASRQVGGHRSAPVPPVLVAVGGHGRFDAVEGLRDPARGPRLSAQPGSDAAARWHRAGRAPLAPVRSRHTLRTTPARFHTPRRSAPVSHRAAPAHPPPSPPRRTR